MVGVQIEGLPQIALTAKKAMEVLIKWNEKATHQNMVDLKNEAIKIAPYKSGELRRSIARYPENLHTIDSVTYAQYGSDLPYARILELGGTIPEHNIFPKNRNALAWYDPSSQFAAQGGKYRGWVFAKQTHIKAQHRTARPYLFPVLVLGIDRCLERYKEAYAAAMAEIGAK